MWDNTHMATIDDLKKARLEKLEALRKMGVDPYPPKVRRDHTVTQAREMDGSAVVPAASLPCADTASYHLGCRRRVRQNTGGAEGRCMQTEAFALVQYFDIADIVAVQEMSVRLRQVKFRYLPKICRF